VLHSGKWKTYYNDWPRYNFDSLRTFATNPNVTTYNAEEGGGGGKQATATQFEGKENKIGDRGFERLKQAIRVFMKEAIDTTSSHFKLPTTIIIDDLQWADGASIEILKPMITLGGGRGDKSSWKGFL
jgi:hypothetical protein